MDRVVSSYTATVRALLHATGGTQAPATDSGGAGDRVLVVAVPRTPGERDLPGARREVDLVRSIFPGATVLDGDKARSSTVRAQLPRHSWIHFAGHAALSADPDDGSTLVIPVDDGRPLSVHDIRRLRVAGVEAAVLSACGTAAPLRRLPDESLHLAAAFQLAGYWHVTATLWPVSDSLALRMTRSLYRQVACADPPRGDALPLALHHAVRQLRRRWPDRPTIWAAHVHAGA
jgi:CHAT domain-containing protein